MRGGPPSRPGTPPPVKPTGSPVKPPVRPAPITVPRTGSNRVALQAASLPSIGSGAYAPELVADISALQSTVQSLQSKSALTDVQADVSQLDQNLTRYASQLEALRKQGYVYAGDIDGKLYDLIGQWQTVKPQVDNAIYQHGTSLYQSAMTLQGPLAQLQSSPTRARSLLPGLTSSANSLLSNAQQVERNIEAMYSQIESGASDIGSRLWRLEEIMKVVMSAKFKTAQGEAPIAAAAAKMGTKDDDPRGFLYLTDKRLIFEQKQEIVKKKVLFIATEKEMVHQVLLETPLTAVTSANASSKGLFGHEDHLDVEYSGKSAHFHLDGQDSDEWAKWIDRAKAGGYESERAAAGAGISIADLSGPVTQSDILALQSEVNDLQKRAMLSFAKDALEDIETKVKGLPGKLSGVRARGYAFEKALEAQVQGLTDQWVGIKQTLSNDLKTQTMSMGSTMVDIQQKMAQVMGQSANPSAARPAYMQVKSMIASVEAQAVAAEQGLYGQYDDFQASVETLNAHLEWVDWMLEALASASFTFMATEGGVAAAQANWLRPNSDPMGGILFLSDQRVIFEEREGEFSVPLEAALSLVQSVEALAGQGAGQDEEHLRLNFGAGAPASFGLFQLVGPTAEEWKTTIGRAMKGDYTSDRALEIDQAAVDKVKNAPTQCPSCGAAFTKPVLRGQTEIKCEFCGAVTRL